MERGKDISKVRHDHFKLAFHIPSTTTFLPCWH